MLLTDESIGEIEKYQKGETKMKKYLALILAMTMVLCLLSGCGSSASKETASPDAAAATASPEANKSLKIGLSMYTLEYPF